MGQWKCAYQEKLEGNLPTQSMLIFQNHSTIYILWQMGEKRQETGASIYLNNSLAFGTEGHFTGYEGRKNAGSLDKASNVRHTVI